MHLHGDMLHHYRARELPEPTLAAIDVHVSNCLFCAHALAEDDSASGNWERRGWLGRLVRTDASAGLDENGGEPEAQAA